MNYFIPHQRLFLKHFIGIICFLISGLSSIQAQVYNGSVGFYNQTEIDTFPPYSVITGSVSIYGADVKNVDSLYELTEIQGFLTIDHVDSLESLDGFRNLTSIGGTLYLASKIAPNNALTNLDSLANLTHIGGYIEIRDYPALANIDGLAGLTKINGKLVIDNTGVQNVDGLANVDSIQGDLRLISNHSLLNIDGLSGIQNMDQNITIFYNTQLINVNGLINVKHCQSLRLVYNNNLVDISGLSNLETIGSTATINNQNAILDIWGCPSLTNLNGFQNLQRVLGKTTIAINQLLTQVDGLSGLDSIYNDLRIESNDVLKDLYGLRNINFYEGEVTVIGNPQLEECCGIYNYVDTVGIAAAALNISGNGINCEAGTILAEGPCAIQDQYYLTGIGYYDINNDCQYDSLDLIADYQIVQVLPGPYYGSTDATGNYLIPIDTGSYSVSILPQSSNWENCDTAFTAVVLSTDSIVSIPDWGIQRDSCPDISLSIGGFWNRRCFQGDMAIDFCNWGLTSSTQTQLSVVFPKYLDLISANYPFSYGADSIIIFDIGTLNPSFCSSIQMITEVSCSSIEILDLTQCVEAWFSSPDFCPLSAPNWSGASIAIQQSCMDSINRFTVVNQGSGNMIDSTGFRIFADDSLVQTGNLFLNSYDTLVFDIPSNGQMFRLEVDQEVNHPNNTMVAAALEGCVPDLSGAISKGFINQYPLPIRDPRPTFTVACLEIVGAYDPNDKRVFPSGFGPMGLTPPGSRLQYLIRFQNTGTDTAFNIVVSDTLSADFDMSTFQIESSSHPYRLEVSGLGRPTLDFHFEDIQLPDSNVNEPASHGFIQFSVDHLTTAPLGTAIENFADIYFDFNPPIRTNTVLNTLSDFQNEAIGSISGITQTYIENLPTNIENEFFQSFTLYPNPAKELIHISGKNFKDNYLEVEWLDLHGRILHQSRERISSPNFTIEQSVPDIPSGLYLIRLNKKQLEKIVIH